MENLEPKDINQIQRYIHRLTSPEETSAIEARIATDKEFAEEVEIRRIALQFQFTETKNHLKSLLEEMEREGAIADEKPLRSLKTLPPITKSDEEPERGRVISLWPKRIAVAAVVVVALGVGIWFALKPDPNANGLADKDKKPDVETPVNIDPSVDEMVNGLLSEARQPREDVPARMKDAVGKFENENDDEAIRILQGLKTTRPATPAEGQYGASKGETKEVADPVLESYRKFYLGVSYLNKGEPAKALIYLKQVKAPLEEDGRWYTALAYLKNNEPAKAKPILTEINGSPSSRYAGEAGLLLQELK